MKYVIEVTTKVFLEIEDPGSEEKAIEQACGIAWQYDPDEQNARVVYRIFTTAEAVDAFEKAAKEDTDPERNELRERLKKAFTERGKTCERMD